MSDGPVLYESRGDAVWISINRPERRNALDTDAIEALIEALERAGTDAAARCVVVTGTGDSAFCAGGDLGVMAPAQGRVAQHEARGRLGDLLTILARHPKPVVARVNGVALGGGFGLALACDLVVAAESAEFGTPEVSLGLWPFIVTAVIQRNVPRKLALELMLTGRRMPASEAQRWGIVNRVVPSGSLDDEVGELVAALSSRSAVALRMGRQSFHRAQDMAFDDAVEYLNAMLTAALESEDVAEGVSAFLEKRSPRWKDR